MSVQAPEATSLDVAGVSTALIDVAPRSPGTSDGTCPPPVLLLHGSGRDDRVVPWRVSSGQLIDLLPNARLHVLSGCGHWTMIEKTADFLAVVRPFLA
jgi:alpha-beta hydrolase superfamily lysophospholipase